MRSSRAPESRGTPKPVIFLVLIAVLLFAGLAATYFTQGFGAFPITPAQAEVTAVETNVEAQPSGDSVSAAVNEAPVVILAPTATPVPEPTAGPPTAVPVRRPTARSDEHTPELQSHAYLVCRLRLEKKNTQTQTPGVT